MDTQKTRTAQLPENWPDGANLALGLWIILSPFVLGFGDYLGALGSCVGFGVVIAVLAILALTRPETWEEGVNVIVGLCLAVSPWLFNFATDRVLTTNAVLAGIAVIALAAWSMARSMPGDHWWHHTHRGSH